jgi:hypothetical protein
MKIWETKPTGTLWATPGLSRDSQHDSAYNSHHQGFHCDISGGVECPTRLWVAPNLPFSGHRGSFLELGRPEREVNHIHLVPSLRMSETTLLLLPPPYAFISGTGKNFTLTFRFGAIKELLPRLCTEHLHEVRMGRKSWRCIMCRLFF